MGDAPDHPAFSCGVAPLEDHNDLELLCMDPSLQFDEFALKLEKRPGVDHFPNGLMRGWIGDLPHELC